MTGKTISTFAMMVAAALFATLSTVGAAAPRADGETVSGTVTAQGRRQSSDIVISLRASDVVFGAASEPVEMDQKGMTFIPHVLAVTAGSTVRFLNSDPVPHNVFSPEANYNLGTWPTGETRDYVFEAPGVYTQLCRVHPEMESFVVVLDTPYFATTDAAGAFTIENVPAGDYTLVAWGDRLKEVERPVTVEAGRATTVDLTLSR